MVFLQSLLPANHTVAIKMASVARISATGPLQRYSGVNKNMCACEAPTVLPNSDDLYQTKLGVRDFMQGICAMIIIIIVHDRE